MPRAPIAGRIVLVALLIAAVLLILSFLIPTVIGSADGAACPPAPIACQAPTFEPWRAPYLAPVLPAPLRRGLALELRSPRRPR